MILRLGPLRQRPRGAYKSQVRLWCCHYVFIVPVTNLIPQDLKKRCKIFRFWIMEIITPGDPGKLKGQLNVKFLGTFKRRKGIQTAIST